MSDILIEFASFGGSHAELAAEAQASTFLTVTSENCYFSGKES